MARSKKTQEVDNKISISQLKEALDNDTADVKYTISISDMRSLCESVADFCFSEDSFNSYAKELVAREYVLLYYSGVNYKDVSELQEFCYSDYFDRFLCKINKFQYESILRSIDDLVEFKKQVMLKQINSASDDAINNVNNLIVSVRDIVNKLYGFVDSLDGEKTLKLLEQISPAFADMNGKFDQEKMVTQVLDTMKKENKPARKSRAKKDNVVEFPVE